MVSVTTGQGVVMLQWGFTSVPQGPQEQGMNPDGDALEEEEVFEPSLESRSRIETREVKLQLLS